jgi:hypothetical protein
MKLLVVGAANGTKRMLRKLAASGVLEIEWRGVDDELSRRTDDCAAVLIDGSAARSDRAAALLERVGRLQRRIPGVPVLVLSRLGAERSGSACGVIRRDGMLHAQCRLKSLAWHEAQALLADALQRELLEPVTFEFRG